MQLYPLHFDIDLHWKTMWGCFWGYLYTLKSSPLLSEISPIWRSLIRGPGRRTLCMLGASTGILQRNHKLQADVLLCSLMSWRSKHKAKRLANWEKVGESHVSRMGLNSLLYHFLMNDWGVSFCPIDRTLIAQSQYWRRLSLMRERHTVRCGRIEVQGLAKFSTFLQIESLICMVHSWFRWFCYSTPEASYAEVAAALSLLQQV